MIVSKHADRHFNEDVDSTYGTIDNRRNEWREERREKSTGFWDDRYEETFGSREVRKQRWRNEERDKY